MEPTFGANLVAAIRRARQALREDRQGDLTAGYRQLIYAAIGPAWDFDNALEGANAYRVRVNLATSSVEKVLHFWQRVWPENPLPYRLLRVAGDVKAGRRPRTDASREADEGWCECDGIVAKERATAIAILVGYGAVQVVRRAVFDETCDPGSIDVALSDVDVDPDEMDSSGLAAAVWAGGTLWDGTSDPAKRREFWEWWLTTAIQSAWEMELPPRPLSPGSAGSAG